jgi:hypothetical protein
MVDHWCTIDLTMFCNIIAVLGPGQSSRWFAGQLPSCMTLMRWTGWLIQHSRVYTLPNPSPVLPMLLPCVSRYELHFSCTAQFNMYQTTNHCNPPCESNLCCYSLSLSSGLLCLRWCKHWSGWFRGPTWPGECLMARRLLGDRMTRTRTRTRNFFNKCNK